MSNQWTNDEIEYLKGSWGNVKIETIKRYLNKRSKEAIKIKATRLGLGGAKTNSYKYITASQASKILGVDRHKILKWIKEKKLRAKFQALTREAKFWCIEYDYFIEWLENNQQLYDASKIEEYALGYEYDWLIRKRQNDKNIKQRGVIHNERKNSR